MTNKDILKKMKKYGYLIVNHSNKSSRKNVLNQANRLANFFLQRNSTKKDEKLTNILDKNNLDQKSLFNKFNLLKLKHAKDSSRLYNMLGRDVCLSDHHNDKNIIDTLNILFKKKKCF